MSVCVFVVCYTLSITALSWRVAVEKKKRVRIVLDLSEEAAYRLDTIKELVIGETRTAVIRQALQLFEYIASEASENKRFFVGHSKEAATEIRLIGLS